MVGSADLYGSGRNDKSLRSAASARSNLQSSMGLRFSGTGNSRPFRNATFQYVSRRQVCIRVLLYVHGGNRREHRLRRLPLRVAYRSFTGKVSAEEEGY